MEKIVKEKMGLTLLKQENNKTRLRAGSQDKDSPKDDHNLPNSQVDGGNEINSANCLPSKHLSYLTIPSLLILFYVKK